MLKNNVEVDVKVKCIEESVTQVQLAEAIGTSAPYVSRLIKNNDKIVNKTFLQLMEQLVYVKRDGIHTTDAKKMNDAVTNG